MLCNQLLIHQSYDSHGTLSNITPNQVFTNNDEKMTRHINNSDHNQQV
jgi:hypothetical protein